MQAHTTLRNHLLWCLAMMCAAGVAGKPADIGCLSAAGGGGPALAGAAAGGARPPDPRSQGHSCAGLGRQQRGEVHIPNRIGHGVEAALVHVSNWTRP